MTFAEAAILFNLVVLTLMWSGLSAWFGYRRFQGRIFRYIVAGAAARAGRARWSGRASRGWSRASTRSCSSRTARSCGTSSPPGSSSAFLFALVTALIAHLRNREYRALTAHLEAEARQSETSRQLAESKLKLLQLQIEPHFLFNTLGSAQQLAEKGAPDAARLIGDLIRFLRAATPALRDEVTTVRQEADDDPRLSRHHADAAPRRLAWSRLGAGRPRGRGDAARHADHADRERDQARHRAVAAGRPRRRHGDARRREAMALCVADTGAGLAAHPGAGGGIGLANIRERLALLYGGRATLELEENEPRGFRARILLPLARHAPLRSHPTFVHRGRPT